MSFLRLELGPKLSWVSWLFIEIFSLSALFFLPFSKSVAEITMLVALILWLLRKWPWNEPFPAIPHANRPYIFFLLFTVISLFNVPAEAIGDGLQGLFRWLRYVAVFFMFYEFSVSPKRRRRLLWVFLFSIGFLLINAGYQFMTGADWVKNYSIDTPGRFIRLKSSLGSPNSLACFLSIALPLTFGLWLKENKWSWRSVFYLLLLAVFFTGLLATLSRSVVLALAISVGLYLILHRKINYFVFFAVFSVALLWSSQLFLNNFIVSIHFGDITIGERLRFWQITWGMIKNSPWFGNGVNMYYQKFAAFAPATETYRGYAHNCYLQMWSEIGILGLVAFLWPLAAILGRQFSCRTRGAEFSLKDALGISLATYLIQSFFDTNFYSFQVAMLFWIFWGVYVALANKESIRYNPGSSK